MTLTIGQSGSVEICPNSVRFSTFLGTEWEFLHAVFTTTRFLIEKQKLRAHRFLANKKTECPGGFNCVLRHS